MFKLLPGPATCPITMLWGRFVTSIAFVVTTIRHCILNHCSNVFQPGTQVCSTMYTTETACLLNQLNETDDLDNLYKCMFIGAIILHGQWLNDIRSHVHRHSLHRPIKYSSLSIFQFYLDRHIYGWCVCVCVGGIDVINQVGRSSWYV